MSCGRNPRSLFLPDESRQRCPPHRIGAVGAVAMRRGCRKNHSESWCINWSWDTTIRVTRWNGAYWDSDSEMPQIHPPSPTLERSTYFRGFIRQPPPEAVARRERAAPSRLTTGKSGAGKQVGFRFYGGCRVMRANMTEWEIDVPNSPVWGRRPISVRESAGSEVMRPTTSAFPNNHMRSGRSSSTAARCLLRGTSRTDLDALGRIAGRRREPHCHSTDVLQPVEGPVAGRRQPARANTPAACASRGRHQRLRA